MITKRPAPPLWFLLLLAATEVAVWRALGAAAAGPAGDGGQACGARYAFWGFIILVADLIWRGVQTAATITIQVLHWLVINLSLVVTKLVNGLKALGAGVLLGLRKAWDFFELTYDHVIKPAWSKFWRWFDRLRRWLDDTFGPIIDWLRDVRDALLDFWGRYIRPWLDLIDVTRRGLRVLSALGVKWAGELDRRLADLEEAIERPFKALVAKINEVITLIDRVITADGLFQRVALIRSMERDIRYAARALNNWRLNPLTAKDWEGIRAKTGRRTAEQSASEVGKLVARGEGPLAGLAAEMAASWRIQILGRR